mmetsp:Transcript_44464/g.106054  ORF Transcript_44464/g.106054 Transcript_44464/m.106054 type:complete len:247 (+) Transcript_44464:5335-6075(+)
MHPLHSLRRKLLPVGLEPQLHVQHGVLRCVCQWLQRHADVRVRCVRSGLVQPLQLQSRTASVPLLPGTLRNAHGQRNHIPCGLPLRRRLLQISHVRLHVLHPVPNGHVQRSHVCLIRQRVSQLPGQLGDVGGRAGQRVWVRMHRGLLRIHCILLRALPQRHAQPRHRRRSPGVVPRMPRRCVFARGFGAVRVRPGALRGSAGSGGLCQVPTGLLPAPRGDDGVISVFGVSGRGRGCQRERAVHLHR